jgi:hypothetical protein
MEIVGVEKDVIYSKKRYKIQVAAKSLLCYCAVRDREHTTTELAKRFGQTQPAVSYTVIRGKQRVKERHYNLVS